MEEHNLKNMSGVFTRKMSENTIVTKSFDFGKAQQHIEVTISTAPVNYIDAILLS